MFENIMLASKNFCTHQINFPCSVKDGISDRKTIITYIDIETLNHQKYRVYIASEFDFMQKISKIFLEEDNSDMQTLKDMALETTNLIVGNAKVISTHTNNSYTIGTPIFEKIDYFDLNFDNAKTIQIEDKNMIIAIKKLDD